MLIRSETVRYYCNRCAYVVLHTKEDDQRFGPLRHCPACSEQVGITYQRPDGNRGLS
jgi:hypothetical protein